MTSPDPFNFPQSWDVIQIQGASWGGPTGFGGKIKIQNATRFYKIDQKDGQGLDGATQTYRGQKPKPFKLIFSWGFQSLAFTPAEQHQYWVFFSYQFNYTASKPGLPPPVFSVYHPALAILGISEILVEEIGAVEVNEETKLASATVTVRQFYPPPLIPATTTPVGATGDVNVSGYIPGLPTPSALQLSLEAQIQTQLNIANAGTPGALPH